MIVKICDRCRAVIPRSPDYIQAQFPIFSIKCFSSNMIEREINLCHDCEIELEKWFDSNAKERRVRITNGRGEYRYIKESEIQSLKGSDWKVVIENGVCFTPQ